MSRNCEKTICLDLTFQSEICLDLNFASKICLDVCVPGKGLNPSICDIVFIDYQTEDECELTIDSVSVSGTVATINASGGVGTTFYRFLDADGETVLRDWSTTNSYDTGAVDTYFAQAADTFGCVDTEEFETETPPDDLSFQSSSDTTILSSDTSITSTIPADVEAGDMMILSVMHRDTLTPPSGWTLIGTTPGTIDFDQLESKLYRIAQEGDEGTVVTSQQATANRFVSHIQVFRNSGLSAITVVNSDNDDQATSGLSLPEIASTVDGQMAVVSMSNVYSRASDELTEINPPTGYTQTTPISIEDNRLGCAYKQLSHPETISGRFEITLEGTATDTDRTAFSVILGFS